MPLSANNPKIKSWLAVPENSDFPIQNIPFGVFLTRDDVITIGTRIGDHAIDLGALHQLGYFKGIDLTDDIFLQDSLNDFIADGRKTWRLVRNRISDIFNENNSNLRDNPEHRDKILFNLNEIEMQLPVDVGDYTDFYASKEHATNVGSLFRDPENALLPNWLHIPIGYHGRSSSIVPSGTPIYRPNGQSAPKDGDGPGFGPSRLLDFELEMAFITTAANDLGKPISIKEDALEPFRVEGPKQNPEPLTYLKQSAANNYDITLEANIMPENGRESLVCRSNFKYMYWSMAQQLAHHTINGCNLRSGDMMGSGTISGPTPDSYGSMLELSWRGQKPVPLNDGTTRTFIQDGDTVVMRGYSQNEHVRIGFGECTGKILPARTLDY